MFPFVNGPALILLRNQKPFPGTTVLRILRLLVVGGTLGLSVGAIAFTCADRLAHPAPDPVPLMARFPPFEPTTTGSIAKLAIAPPPPVVKATDGFDTERLNALLRGDPIAGPTRKR